MRVVQCFSCKDFGHIARDYPKNFCNYCKKQGHIIYACPIWPERKQGIAYHVSTNASSFVALLVASSVIPIPAPTVLANPNTLTPEMVQQMIISAFGLLVALLGFTSSELRLKFFQSLSIFLYLLRLNSLPASRYRALILAENTCLMSFKTFFKAKESFLNVLVLRHHKKMVLLRGKISTFLMWFKPGFVYERRSRHEFGSTSSMPPSDLDSAPDPALTSTTLRWSTRLSQPPGLQALEENHTWDIVPRSPTVKPIGRKWVFSGKLHSDGSLDPYKARLVAMGNKQEFRVDYEETFAPIAKMTTVRTILVIVASQSWQLHQMDVKNVFLHGDLQEEIYMKLPSGMTNSSPHDVCKLKRSLYGLKQAPQDWFEKFRNTILSFSFTQSQYDSSLFFHTSALGIILLLVYVDDIIIIGTDYGLITKLQRMLHTTFHMKDLGQLTYFLGLEVHYLASGIFMNQHKKHEGDLLDDLTLYRRLVGSLIYLTTTRPDISYAVHQKQDRVSKSSTKAKYCAMSTACSEIVWLRGLLEELRFPQTTSTPLHADNTNAIQIATNPIFHECTKHIEVDCHSIRDTLESRVISLPYISSDLQVADIVIKAFTRQQHQFLVGKLLLVDLPTSI
ncbi:Retrovirus-related Pol polyprotein from transposon RE1 [Vitis vinifera]|uniref:Retrovirus-related Pol polyprotein from transposon RE1 n=1 Tax=Vitis vinifera TaxID=29760 RepID=A0A438EIX7_VITVI|nr:Retrovirus-related Pol polyprotein from transposon RE1 [Vitis vinifera]